ncbi:mitochondrial fission ELM1 family protein [Dyella subtropica]|uniref:mitochondrial fission ELM1 family protein n=1 Tax=Dyella subtropica TaxID=2992127 RepID=UPI002250F852|nr:mitochondrial fission ELM1 family protein [Dyella subtropica]
MLKLHGDCWVITDGRAGNDRQALALAEQLGLPFRHLVLGARAPWSWFTPRLMLGGRLALPIEQRRDTLIPPWPSVVIGCGRTAALYTRLLRRLSEGYSYTVQILDPRMAPSHWDAVIAPKHDLLSGPNVLHTLGSLNLVDDTWLADGRDICPTFDELPQPRVGVLLGGPRKGMPLDPAYAEQLADRLITQHRHDGGSLLVLASRRTPDAVMAVMRRRLHNIPGLIWSSHEDGTNPYPGVLGWADRLIVTPDSVNMLSEACAVGCPVQTFIATPLPAKIARFHRALRDASLLHDIDETLPMQRQLPLRETMALTSTLRLQIAEHQAQSHRTA